MTLHGARIAGNGYGNPTKTITNADLEKMVDTSDEWIVSRTGIKERRIVDYENGQTHTEICVEAANKAIANAGVKNSDIDMVIVCTISPDTFMPNGAARICDRLEISCGSFDLSAACAGWVLGMHTARSFVMSGMHKNVLVIGAEVLSRHVDYSDRNLCILFGDGAGATIVQASTPDSTGNIISSKTYTWPDMQESLASLGSASRHPAHTDDFDHSKAGLSMNGKEVFKYASKGMALAATEVVAEAGWKLDEIDWFVPHQANLRIIEMVAKLLRFPMEKVYVNIDRWGNTSSATLPTCLGEMQEKGLLKPGQKVLFDTFGGGFSFGAMAVQY